MPSMNVNSLLDGDTLWRGHSPHHGPDRGMADRVARQPTGYAALDTVLPRGGWQRQAHGSFRHIPAVPPAAPSPAR